MRERGEPTETRGMAEQGRHEHVDVSTRTFVICLVIVLVLLGALALYLKFGR
jgi:hypothetical protein